MIITNNLTKVFLSAQKYDFFVKITGLENWKDFLAFIKKIKMLSNSCKLTLGIVRFMGLIPCNLIFIGVFLPKSS